MTRKFAALLAALMLSMLAVAPGFVGMVPSVAAATPVPPGTTPHYFGPSPNWANSPLTLPDATVTIDPAPIAPVIVGNPLIDRANATDYATAPGVLAPVFVVLPGAVLPDGTLTSFEVWNQTLPGGPNLPEGNLFHAYVLHPTGTANQYAVLFDSGEKIMPASTNPAGEVASFDVPGGFAVTAGDVIGFYGQGVPVDVGGGSDILSYPATANADLVTPQAPAQGDTLSLGSDPGFPLFSQDRIYSFQATVVPPGTGAGGGATATATVGANGVVTGLTITDPGSGYTTNPNVTITSSNPAAGGATAEAVIQLSGAVTSVTMDANGSGYTAPTVLISGGGATTDATAHALGGVDAVSVVAGSGYKFPVVDFDLPDDPNGVQAQGHATCEDPYPDCNLTVETDFLTVSGVVVDSAGSGYSTAPAVVIRDGTQFDPINHGTDPFTEATGTATLKILSVVLDTFGAGYTGDPDVAFGGGGIDAAATAATDFGAVTQLNLLTGGSGYLTPGGIKKFQDTLPGLNEPNNLGQFIPVAVADKDTFPDDLATPDVNEAADYYVIAVIQHRERMSSSLPAAGTLLREYVQLTTDGSGVALSNDMLDGSSVDALMPNGDRAMGVTEPHYLGPTIVAERDKAVRIVFYNLLPKGAEGDLFLPVDTTVMGSGPAPSAMGAPADQGLVTDGVRNPMCTQKYADPTMRDMCFTENRATLHLHGGVTPWISDGTPHQWITPANETTPWPEGVSVQNVPDMVGASKPANVPDCTADDDGCQTFYYTNQQSARLMFYHDHAWGITRLNVYAGEAAGYVITDKTEQKLFGPTGTYASMGEGIPLVIQDRTFVPSTAQLLEQDPTWDATRWGGEGNLWYHHVYMPAQNPGDPSGMSAYGRWMYGPWFWPPATPEHGPIANPYYDSACNLDDPDTWQYTTDPFCEPAQIPGTPNISVGMEQFNDTPIVNGTAYPTKELQPQAYRFRILNAANDRFWNLQWYVADSTGTEVALKADEVAAAQTDVNIIPSPDLALSPAGPDWIQFGTEGGFLPAPVVVDGQQVTTYITDPTRFDVGNVDKHSLLLAPAERADVIVDFSQFKGKTLILYNDAPAAFPARVPSYDYYTGGPDGLTLPGYGPNTRTIMQVTIPDVAPAQAFNVAALSAAFTHKANGSGVFEEGQHPIIVGQAGYNSAYGKTFVASGDCSNPAGTNKCDGFARINQQGGDLFRFDTLRGPQLKIPLQPKALHDEMNSAAFDEFGRMTANLGLEAVPATPALQNIYLYPYIAPPTEVIDATNLPKGDINVTAISDGSDGTQIWKITHNGVDTHPIHFHLYDVQVLNRVTWDNIIIPPEKTELGWKDTVRISPLEDTIVALRPIIPTLPFEIPNSVRTLSPMMPRDVDLDPQGLIMAPNGTVTTVLNAVTNFGWEYVYHCHILSHEEMDMMRPVLVALPPKVASGLNYSVTGNGNNTRLTLTWTDNSITETSFLVQKQAGSAGAWTTIGTVAVPLDPDPATTVIEPNTAGGTRSFTDTTFRWNSTQYFYRVVARNTVGWTGGVYPTVNADSVSATIAAIPTPSNLTASLQANGTGVQVRLSWTDNNTNETGYVVQRSTDGVTFTQIATPGPHSGSGAVTYIDTTVEFGVTYTYRVAAVTPFGTSGSSNTAQVVVPAQPAAPSGVTIANGANQGSQRSVVVQWTDNSNNETGFTIQRATNAGFTTGVATTNAAANATTATVTGLSRNTTYWFRVRANNGTIVASAYISSSPASILTNP
jgi:FtsP/CotA-like multicopper oxidase with cupredoxin domain